METIDAFPGLTQATVSVNNSHAAEAKSITI